MILYFGNKMTFIYLIYRIFLTFPELKSSPKMSKRQHEEAVEAIQLKPVKEECVKGAEKEEDGGVVDKKDLQEQEQKGKGGKIGLFHGSDFGETKQIPIGPGGMVHFDARSLCSVTIHSLQDWTDGIDKEVLEFLAKLVEQEKGQPKDRKYCLNLFLAYSFKGDQEAVFGRNLSALLAVPGFTDSLGAFTYSEGGELAKFLGRFPQFLTTNPNFPNRYDVNVYCENETLVEHYYADIKYWLIESNKSPSPGDQSVAPIRQCRLKFFYARGDTAEEMLDLFKKDFNEATDAEKDKRTFVVRIDCPAFSLDEFAIKNEKTGEILALKFKREQVLGTDDDDEGMDEKIGEAPTKRTRSTGEENAKNGAEGQKEKEEDGEEEERITWKTYNLVRSPAGEVDHLMAKCQVPFLKRTLSIIY